MSSSIQSPEIDASSRFESSLPMTSLKLLSILDEIGIGYDLHQHPPLRTVEESQRWRGEMDGAHIKNLYLRDGKKRNYLVVADENKTIDLKNLSGDIGANRLSFGSAERLIEFLGVRPGAVSPLALINDKENRVKLVFDQQLLTHDKINLHPLVNDKTITISFESLKVFLNYTQHLSSQVLI